MLKQKVTSTLFSYELMEPLHRLWLGYISELLNLPLRNTASAADLSRNALVDPGANGSNGLSSTMRMEENSRECLNISIKSALEDGISVSTMQGWQTKLVKADFHGARIQGTLSMAFWRNKGEIEHIPACSQKGQASGSCWALWHCLAGDRRYFSYRYH